MVSVSRLPSVKYANIWNAIPNTNGIDRINTVPMPALASSSATSSKHTIPFLLNDVEVSPLATINAITTPAVTIPITTPSVASSSSATCQSSSYSSLVPVTSATTTPASSSSIAAPSHGKVPRRKGVKEKLVGPRQVKQRKQRKPKPAKELKGTEIANEHGLHVS